VLLHFGMTGSLQWATSRHRHDRIVLVYSDNELTYRDMRKLHGLRLPPDEAAVRRALADLGPDAATVSVAELKSS
jgi:formamidopyrimidine-DNA glycosylase